MPEPLAMKNLLCWNSKQLRVFRVLNSYNYHNVYLYHSDFDYLWTNTTHFSIYAFSLACEHDTFVQHCN